MGRHRCRLQERDGRPLEAPVLPLAGQGGTRARNEQTRGHLWILLERPLLAKDCRIYIHDLARRLGVPAKGSGLGEGIEIFPRHSAIGEGGFGNAIRGPLGIHRGASRRFWFYGADYTLEAQMAYLNRLRKLAEEELRRFIAGKEIPEDQRRTQREIGPGPRERCRTSEFCILDYVGKVRRVGR